MLPNENTHQLRAIVPVRSQTLRLLAPAISTALLPEGTLERPGAPRALQTETGNLVKALRAAEEMWRLGREVDSYNRELQQRGSAGGC